MRRISRLTLPAFLLLATPVSICCSATADTGDITDAQQEMLNRISARSMRGHLSFIASDLLEGRDTPSKGLDIAAQYIAAQFMRAGLEPIGDDGYFQTSAIETAQPSPDDFQATIATDAGPLNLSMDQISVQFADGAVTATDARAIIIPFDIGEIEVEPGGFVAITSMPSFSTVGREQRQQFFSDYSAFMTKMGELGAVAVLNLDPTAETGTTGGRGFGRGGWPAVFQVHGEAISRRLGFDGERWQIDADTTITLSYQMPKRVGVPVRNVVGLLRGSDPQLADEYIIVTGHYDHVGIGSPVDGDSIYNGANDDGSGTTCVMEIATAMAQLDPAPKRSIIFMCVYGEEKGLLGTRHYAANPIVPLEKTIANINLEHMGRTDDSDGPSVNQVMPTGFDYSNVIDHFVEAGNEIGFGVIHHPLNSANFFARSDNVAFAQMGIPAHTFCAAFIFPDYHGAGDHWELVDYDNMAKAARMVALGLVKLAAAPEAPRWNEDHRSTGRYVRAWKQLHGIED